MATNAGACLVTCPPPPCLVSVIFIVVYSLYKRGHGFKTIWHKIQKILSLMTGIFLWDRLSGITGYVISFHKLVFSYSRSHSLSGSMSHSLLSLSKWPLVATSRFILSLADFMCMVRMVRTVRMVWYIESGLPYDWLSVR